ncbi:MAG: universal stress protein [Halobacteriales archaeon SW_9_67_25]|jgi:nucleotide-binding universal stress UspA family protein|nr:MAG: universal stress protein [Halobacteriales archaeon SW_9_67_25]
MYDDILLPTDGSSGTVEVMEHALPIASDRDATVHALYVVESRLYRAADDDTKDDVRATLEEEGDRALEDARIRIEDAGVGCVTERREGTPQKEITEYADEAGIDLIVMGTHSKTGPGRMASLGSTTERVVKNADQPVLVVDIR